MQRQQQQVSSLDTFANLERLSQKPSVVATLVISRQDGMIIRSSGLELEENASKEGEVGAIASAEDENSDSMRMISAEMMARLVFDFVNASTKMAKDMSRHRKHDIKLLRMRTDRNELVIVPGQYGHHFKLIMESVLILLMGRSQIHSCSNT